MIQRTILIALVCILGNTSFGCSQAVSGFKLVTNEPVLNSADGVDFYAGLPNQIVMWRRGQNGEWVKSSTETIKYQTSSGHVVLQTKEYQEASQKEAKLYRNEYRWEDARLVEIKESSKRGFRNDSTFKTYRRTVFHYDKGQETSIDVYQNDVLSEKYAFEYGNGGNIASYMNQTLSPFSHEWELSYKKRYTYDSRNRVTKIESEFPGMESETTTLSYNDTSAIVISSDRVVKLTYDNDGHLVREDGKYTSGEYRYHRVDLTYDKKGRLIEYTSRYSDSEDTPNQGTPHDLRYELKY